MLVSMLIMAGAAAASPAGAVINFKSADVLVVDAANRPLFRSDRDYLFKLAANPAGRVVRYDPVGRRILVSMSGPEYWVRCAEVKPMTGSCAAPAAHLTRGLKPAGAAGPDTTGLAARGLPSCPGDPRCPKAD